MLQFLALPFSSLRSSKVHKYRRLVLSLHLKAFLHLHIRIFSFFFSTQKKLSRNDDDDNDEMKGMNEYGGKKNEKTH